MATPPSLISLVFPIYNEGDALPHLRTELAKIISTLELIAPVEIVAVDDGSNDNSLALLRAWSREDKRLRVASLTRNFGQQAALTCGVTQARGDIIITIDADLQDPLSLIATMIEKIGEGFDVVHTRRSRREREGLFKRITSWLFYRIMVLLSPIWIVPDSGDFRAFSRRAKEAFLRLPERHRFLRGMSVWIGFPQTVISFERKGRVAGSGKFSMLKMAGLAWDAALSFSLIPLKMIVLLGFVVSFFGISYGGYAVYRSIIIGDTVPGWTTLIVLNSLIGGATLISIGVVGLFVGKIYEEVKQRPIYLIQELIGD